MPYTLTAEHDRLAISPMCLFDIGDLTLNDRLVDECYWIDSMTGFEDADLRVSSEENSEEDGSSPNPGFYGDRVMTMTGRIMAGDYRTLEVMHADLTETLLPLTEQAMTIYQKDRPEAEMKPPRVKIYCRKADKFQCVKDTTSLKYEWPFTISLRATDPRYLSEIEQGPVAIASSATTAKIYPNADRVTGGPNWSPTAGATRFNLVDEDNTNLNMADGIVTESDEFDTYFTELEMGSTAINAGSVYLEFFVHGATSAFYSSTALLRKADGTILLSLELNASDIWHSASAMLTMTQADVDGLYVQVVHDSRSQYGTYSQIQAIYAQLTWPASSVGTNVTNLGNYPARPKLRFKGPMSNPILSNQFNGHIVKLNGEIAMGSWIEVDVATGLVYDAVGANKFSQFDTSSDWMKIDPGINPLLLLPTGASGAAGVEVRHYHTWMS